MQSHIYAHHKYMHKCTHTYSHTHIYAQSHTKHLCMHTHMHNHTHNHTNIYMHNHANIYTYTIKHTHNHTNMYTFAITHPETQYIYITQNSHERVQFHWQYYILHQRPRYLISGSPQLHEKKRKERAQPSFLNTRKIISMYSNSVFVLYPWNMILRGKSKTPGLITIEPHFLCFHHEPVT